MDAIQRRATEFAMRCLHAMEAGDNNALVDEVESVIGDTDTVEVALMILFGMTMGGVREIARLSGEPPSVIIQRLVQHAADDMRNAG